MANEYVSMVVLEVQGKEADVISVVPRELVFKEEVQTMNNDGFIRKRPKYGLTIEVAENNNYSKNPFWENVEDGTIRLSRANGVSDTYPEATCLSVKHSGYSVDGGVAKFTYEFKTAKPSNI